MIVRKLWTTRKHGKWNAFYFEGHFYDTQERHWEGYFLFGIIPLWINNTRTLYR
jgi:hypothetical protein